LLDIATLPSRFVFMRSLRTKARPPEQDYAGVRNPSTHIEPAVRFGCIRSI
jgi:hypothetical protein